MSEQIKKETFDFMAQAQADSRFKQYSEWVGETPDPEAARDVVRFLETRPTDDTSTSGAHSSSEYPIDDNTDAKSLSSYSLMELAAKMGEADARNDKTTVLDISDIVEGRLIDTFKQNNIPADHQDKILDTILKISEQRKAEVLKGSDTDKKSPDHDPSTDKEPKTPGTDLVPYNETGSTSDPKDESELSDLPKIVVDNDEISGKSVDISEREQKLYELFSKARADYIASTAKRRGKLRSKDKVVTAAQERYQSLREQYITEVIKSNREAKISDEVIKNKLKVEFLNEAEYLSIEIARARIEQSGNKLLSGVYRWFDTKLQTNLLSKAGLKDLFTSQGMKDFLKRTGAMSAIMIPVGIGAGIAGSVALGPIAGAVAGAYLGRGIARGIANNKITREGRTASNAQFDSIDEFKSLTDRASKIDMLKDSTSAITEVIGDKTDSLTRRNRRRTLGAVAIGAGTGLVGGVIGDIAHNVLNSGTSGTTQSLKPISHSAKIPKHTAATPHPADTLTSNKTPNIDPSQYADYQNQDPWNYFASPDHGGAANATSTIEALANKAQVAGWRVNSFSSGINSIIAPNGTVYHTTPEIIAALEYFNN